MARVLPAIDESTKQANPVKIAMLAGRGSNKVAQMCDSWVTWGFRPDLVIVEYDSEPSVADRLWGVVKERGINHLVRRALNMYQPVVHVQPAQGQEPAKNNLDAETYCRQHGIEYLVVDDINGAVALKHLQAKTFDLAIHAGAGIIRSPLLALLRLGLVNAHMGILPHYRGMNVSEWAAFNGDPVGCTVHLIDVGIDTGGILCVKPVDTTGIQDIPTLRARVDDGQVALLGEVVRYATLTGKLPPVYAQGQEDGHQYFRMHPELAKLIFPDISTQ